MPRSAARNAAESPPGPAPRTTTSQLKSAESAYADAGAGPAAFTAAGVADFSAAGEGLEGKVAELSPSRTNITEPWETLSPTLSRSSFTTPECEEGISIVALSDSRAMSEASFSTRSPGLTRTSMTSTSLKSPMSGTLTSIICPIPASQEGPAEVGQDRGEIRGEARRGGAVDDSVIVGERQGQNQPRNESPVLEHRPHLGPGHAQDRDLGRIDDRREPRAADAAQAGDAEGASAHIVGLELLFPRPLGDFGELAREVEHAFAVGVADHRHHKPLRRVHRDAYVEVLLDDQVLAGPVERRVEIRELLERVGASLHQERERGELEALLFGDLRLLLAVSFQLGDVGLVVLGDMRDPDPVAAQIPSRKFPDARQRPDFDRPELGEVDLRPVGEIEAQSAARGGARRRSPHAALRAGPFTLARSTPSSRANLRTEGLACGVEPAAGAAS